MTKQVKRWLAWILAVAMVLGSIPNFTTVYATEPSNTEGQQDTTVTDSNNAAVQIRITDSLDGSVIEDATVEYAILTDGDAAPDEKTEWEPIVTDGDATPDEEPVVTDGDATPDEEPIVTNGDAVPDEEPVVTDGDAVSNENPVSYISSYTLQNTSITDGVITVLPENTVEVADGAKLWLKISKENYVTYEGEVKFSKLSGTVAQTEDAVQEIKLDKKILIGIETTYEKDKSVPAATKNSEWDEFLTGKTVTYAVTVSGGAVENLDWKEEIPEISQAGEYDVYVKVEGISSTEERTDTTGSESTGSATGQTAWTQEVTSVIHQAGREVTVTPAAELEYDGKEKTLVTATLTSGSALEAGDKVTWEYKLTDETEWTTVSYTVSEESTTSENTIPKGSTELSLTINSKDVCAGTYQVKLTITGANYNDYTYPIQDDATEGTESISVEIALGTLSLDGLTVTGLAGVYDGSEHEVVSIEKTEDYKGQYTLYYLMHNCTDTPCNHKVDVNAKGWNPEIPKVTDAGRYIVWVKAVQKNYADKDVPVAADETIKPFNVYIQAAPDILKFKEGFETGASTEHTYKTSEFLTGKTYDFAVTYDTTKYGTDKQITYSVQEATSVGENNEIVYKTLTDDEEVYIAADGTLTVKRAGVYKVTASFAGDENCAPCTLTHTVSVGISDGLVVFEDVSHQPIEKVSYIFGKDNGVISNLQATKSNTGDTGAITYTYSIVDNADSTDIGIAIDETTGKLTITDYAKLGEALQKAAESNTSLTVQVTATKAKVLHSDGSENAKYEEDTAFYTVNIQFASTPENPYIISGTLSDNNWYKKNDSGDAVVLTPKEGYSIYETLKDLNADGKGESIGYNTEGTLTANVYLRNTENGGITAPIAVKNIDKTDIQIDITAPENLKIEYAKDPLGEFLETITLGYYQAPVTVRFSAADMPSADTDFTNAASGVKAFEWKYIREDAASSSNVASDENWNSTSEVTVVTDESGTTTYTATIQLPKEEAEDMKLYGHLQVYAVDKAGNISTEVDDKGNVFVVDSIAPQVSITYISDKYIGETNKTDETIYNYGGDITVQLEIMEINFDSADVVVSVSKSIDGVETTQTPTIEWKEDLSKNDTYIGTFSLTEEGMYIISVSYTDKSENAGVYLDKEGNIISGEDNQPIISYQSEKMIIDETAPTIDFSYNDNQTVKFTIIERNFDPTSIKIEGGRTLAGQTVSFEDLKLNEFLQNADNWEQEENTYTCTYDFANGDSYFDGTYQLTIRYTDIANHSATYKTSEFIIDHTAPMIQVDYTKPEQIVDGVSYYKDIHTENPLTVMLHITEANFDANKVMLKVEKEGQELSKLPEILWETDKENTALRHGTFVLAEEGDYRVSVTYTDDFNNVMEEHISPYQLTIDNTLPVVTVTYADTEKENTEDIQKEVFETVDINGKLRKYYAAQRTATIEIAEHNFRERDVAFIIKAYEDATGNELEAEKVEGFYIIGEWEHEGDIHTITISYTENANYSFDITYADLAKNELTDYAEDYFTVDTTAPDAENITIAYQPDVTFIEKIINLVKKFFGFYKDTVTVTFTAQDAESGIKEFYWKYIKDKDASDTNEKDTDWAVVVAKQKEEGSNIYTAEITLPHAEDITHMRGNLQVQAVNRSGIASEIKTDSDKTIVIDKVNPRLQTEHTAVEEGTVYQLVGEKHQYSGEVQFTFIIQEVNFFQEDVSIFISKDGEVSQLQEKDIAWTTKEKDTHYGTFILRDDGDYIVSMKYVGTDKNQDNSGNIMLDKDGNKMEQYQSETITIDTQTPVLDFAFVEAEQKMTFTVKERNFNPKSLFLTGERKDVNGKVIAEDFVKTKLTEMLQNATWTEAEEDTYQYSITYTDAKEQDLDGIYTLSMDYTDYVEHKAETKTTEEFILDRTEPSEVTITYETSPIDVVLEVITLGLYNPSIEVTFTAYDSYSGVKDFTWNYTKTDGASNVNRPTSADSTLTAKQDGTNKSKYTASIKLSDTETKQMHGYVSALATDNYANAGPKTADTGKVFVIDTISPTMKVEYSPENTKSEDENIKYYQENAEVTFYVNEANFYKENVEVSVSKDGGEAVPVTVSWRDESVDEHIGTYTISGDGDYIVYVEYTDYFGNVMTDESGNEIQRYQSHTITIDNTNPELDFAFNKEEQSITFTIKEHNFTADGITLTGSRNDVNGKAVVANYVENELTEILRKAQWTQTQGTDTYTYTIAYKDAEQTLDGIYDLAINYTDKAGRKAVTNEPEVFIFDRTTPSNVTITYEKSPFDAFLEVITLGFYNPSIQVTFTANDEYSGIESFSWDYTKVDGASNVNRPSDEKPTTLEAVQDAADKSKYTATITLSDTEVKQMHGYLSAYATDTYKNVGTKVSDTGKVFVIDTISPTMKVEYSPQDKKNADGSIAYYQNDAQIKFYVNEANFYKENITMTLSKDEGEAVPVTITWESKNVDEHIGTYVISGDGDYKFYVTYSDYSENIMADESTGNELKQYESHIVTIDTINPEIKFAFDEAGQKTTFTIVEHNFKPENIVVTGTRKDVNGKDMNLEQVGLTSLLQNAEWTKNGDVYTYTFDYRTASSSFDGIYNLILDYEDASGRKDHHEAETFIIDRTVPTDIQIAYSKSLLETILETITLGFYNPDVTITFTAYDVSAGVDYFTWNYTKQDGASTINRDTDEQSVQIAAAQDSQDKSKFTAVMKLPNTDENQLRGYLAASSTDKYGNTSQITDDEGHIIIVDTIAPTITAVYSAADRVVGETSYYNGNVDITFTVNEANFFAEDVKVMASKDGGIPYEITATWTDQSTDVHIGTCQLSGDGDYVITVEYTDRSNNKMAVYTSNVLTIDTILPVIQVEYKNTNVMNTLEDSDGQNREYFADVQTAVITITEHNFNAEDVEFTITAEDVTGTTLDANVLHTKGTWTVGSNADTHILEITYPGDANYTFDMAYTDLATNPADDYAMDYFTVDNTAPINLKTEYSTSLLQTILETITFGFYNAKVTVTLTAEDETSSVHEFNYSYINAVGVSDVNKEMISQAIAASEIAYSGDGQIATVQFSIPKDVLSASEQFNGTISFDALDRAGNKNSLEDNRRIIVDNISPTAQITYNEPIHAEGTIDYYDGDVQATVVVNEANFYAEDVIVSITKDDGTSYNVTPTWTDNSVDIHTGTFTLNEDGDYFITVSYRDKSNNEMAVYTSEQLTIDTEIEAPKITFNEKEENGQAYKGEIIPSITFNDINYNSFEVHLYRTSKSDRNVEITEQKELNNLFSINEQGGSAEFDIFAFNEDGKYDVADDGIYHLIVTMKDKAGHSIDSEAYFTINRYGSVYEYSEYLVSLIADGGTYNQEITEDLVITEYNADRLVSDSLEIEITRDGKPLETVDYAVSPAMNEHVAVGESGWFQYEYTISKDNFKEDGIYKIFISSKDATGNAPENSNFEDKNILFYVDSTVPEITSITGLEEGIVDAVSLDVRYIVFDVVALQSVKIYVNGKLHEEITDFSEDYNNYEGSFTIRESNDEQTVRIVVEDKAGNITDTSSETFKSAYLFNGTITLTTNIMARLTATISGVIEDNQPLVIAAAVICGAGGVGAGVYFKRKKKVPTEE